MKLSDMASTWFNIQLTMTLLASDVQIVYNGIAKCCSPIIAGAIVQSVDIIDFAKVEKVFEDLGSLFASELGCNVL